MARDVRTIDRIDQIRMEFFDHVISEEKERAAAEKRQQSACVHRYTVLGVVLGEWQMRSCERCGHEAVRRIRSWERSAGCVVS